MAEASWKEAITQVLKEAGESVHYVEIAKRIIEGGLKTTVGATPPQSVSGIISLSLKNEGAGSPFVKTSRGMYAVRPPADPAQTPEAQAEAQGASHEEDTQETGLLNAFGMSWRRDGVIWAPTSPRICGRQQVGSDMVDFADQAGVYILHDGAHVIYVGRVVENRLGPRLREHTRDRLNGRWDRFSWFGVRGVSESGELRDASGSSFDLAHLITTMEALLIEGLEPPQNRRQGDFDAVEFIQVPDPDIERERRNKWLDELRAAG